MRVWDPSTHELKTYDSRGCYEDFRYSSTLKRTEFVLKVISRALTKPRVN